jgi:hypothetical protein
MVNDKQDILQCNSLISIIVAGLLASCFSIITGDRCFALRPIDSSTYAYGLYKNLNNQDPVKDKTPSEDITNKELADELLAMRSEDIAAGEKAKKLKGGDEYEQALKEFKAVRHRNTARMKSIVAQYGWPTRSLAGVKGIAAAFLIVQHSDDDREFQKYCLPLMKEAGKRGDIELWQIAFLTDRLLVAEGKKQIYGTQFDPCEHTGDPDSPCAIEDPDNVDARRKEMGLGPMKEYIELMKKVRSKSRTKPPNDKDEE